jgi:hypothetical protein
MSPSGPAAAGRVCATAFVKAKPDAVCPEGKDADAGIGTLRIVDARRIAVGPPAARP